MTQRRPGRDERIARNEQIAKYAHSGVPLEAIAEVAQLPLRVVQAILANAAKGIFTGPRGFAGMSTDDQRKVASRGGVAAHEQGTAHEWTSDEAKRAGRKGGQLHGRPANRRKATGYPLT